LYSEINCEKCSLNPTTLHEICCHTTLWNLNVAQLSIHNCIGQDKWQKSNVYFSFEWETCRYFCLIYLFSSCLFFCWHRFTSAQYFVTVNVTCLAQQWMMHYWCIHKHAVHTAQSICACLGWTILTLAVKWYEWKTSTHLIIVNDALLLNSVTAAKACGWAFKFCKVVQWDVGNFSTASSFIEHWMQQRKIVKIIQVK